MYYDEMEVQLARCKKNRAAAGALKTMHSTMMKWSRHQIMWHLRVDEKEVTKDLVIDMNSVSVKT
jgi:hypothetical protein